MLDNQTPDCSLLAICRASVHRKSHRGYIRLGKEIMNDPSEPKSSQAPIKVKKVTLLPMRMLKTTKVSKPENTVSVPPPTGKRSMKDAARSHPLLNFLGAQRRKKVTAVKPEFIRYLEYMKEGGRWDADSNRPVIYFK